MFLSDSGHSFYMKNKETNGAGNQGSQCSEVCFREQKGTVPLSSVSKCSVHLPSWHRHSPGSLWWVDLGCAALWQCSTKAHSLPGSGQPVSQASMEHSLQEPIGVRGVPSQYFPQIFILFPSHPCVWHQVHHVEFFLTKCHWDMWSNMTSYGAFSCCWFFFSS